MSKQACYLALFSLPAIFLLVLNPVEFWWGYKTAGKHVLMPPDVARRAAKGARYTRIIGATLLIALVCIFMRANSVSAISVGLWPSHWTLDLAIGFAGTIALISLKILLSMFTGISLSDRRQAERLYGYHGRLLLWVPVEIFAPFAEEFWRAFCLFAFTEAGYSVVFAVVLTALAFGLGHIGLGPGGALAQATVGVYLALLYIWTGSLLAPFLVHSIANIHFFYMAGRDREKGSGDKGNYEF